MRAGRSEVVIRLDDRGLAAGVDTITREVAQLLRVSRATVLAERRFAAVRSVSGARQAAVLGRLDRLLARRGR